MSKVLKWAASKKSQLAIQAASAPIHWSIHHTNSGNIFIPFHCIWAVNRPTKAGAETATGIS
jgi:hypothetical protein